VSELPQNQGRSGSAAPYVRTPRRALSDSEKQGFLAVADALIPDGSAGRRPSKLDGFLIWLDRALAARRDVFDQVTALAAELGKIPTDDLLERLRSLSDSEGSGFQELSSVVAGAYLMHPDVRSAVGYPGQGPHPARFDQAAEEIMGGILDPVIERGPIYRQVPSRPAAVKGDNDA
jgi:hypothetical protein